MKLSFLIGKPVISLAGESLGYVKQAYVSKNFDKLATLLCVDGEEEEFLLPAHAVVGARDAVIAQDRRLKSASGVPSPVGTGVFDSAGNFLGGAEELDLSEGVLTVVCGSGRAIFPAAYLRSNGATVVCDQPCARKKARKKDENGPKKEIRMQKNDTPPAEMPSPVTESGEPGLLGKQVKKTVAGENGPIANAGEKVTPALLKKAHEHNRLLGLAANTLTE